MVLAKDKKRYLVSLSQKNSFELKRLIKELGLPSGHFSVLLDEHIESLIPLFEYFLEQKKKGNNINIYQLMAKVSDIANQLHGADESPEQS